MKLHYLNGFILSAGALLIVAAAGLIWGNQVLAEPGSPVNSRAWAEYAMAAVIMVVNGILSIKIANEAHARQPAATPVEAEKPAAV
ncbi:MAG: hypothetical protein NT029_20045 [Armatimonadetes bacterium]|nr:hypothetical protein [Armatimonadota bacterium]